mmetsp:Transcript_97823/g.237913  ORF Transcript_97823/g.237913 Transcript_97823/m.237913 type:complete len:264 (-) Transcript_97823:300-1091(-)
MPCKGTCGADSDGLGRKSTSTAVMLSPPMPSVCSRSGERHRSRSSSVTAERFSVPFPSRLAQSSRLPKRARTKSTASWLLITSHTPSQAMSRNSSLRSRFTLMTSGVATMSWSPGGSSLFCLYSRSPMARERLRSPFTRYTTRVPRRWLSTQPPAPKIRASSAGCSGLWSSDMSIALPPRHSTARQSPTLATKIFSRQTQETHAVQPMSLGSASRAGEVARLESARSVGKVLGSASISSTRRKAPRSAAGTSWLGRRAISPGR